MQQHTIQEDRFLKDSFQQSFKDYKKFSIKIEDALSNQPSILQNTSYLLFTKCITLKQSNLYFA